MSRYHFHRTDGGVTTLDKYGTDLPDRDSVRWEAMRLASELIKADLTRVGLGNAWKVEVEDQHGQAVYRIAVAVTETPKSSV